MRIRTAQPADVSAILDISNWAAIHTPANFAIEPESVESWMNSYEHTHRMYPWFVAEDHAGKITGFAKASPHRSRCAYAWTAEVSVYVHPDHHRQGIGFALYSKLIPTLKAQGYVTLLAGIASPHPASDKLHERFGFRLIGVYHKVGWKFDQWHDVSWWECILRTGDRPPVICSVADALYQSD